MYFNYYLEFCSFPLKAAALKTLILFQKNYSIPLNDKLGSTYGRLLYNVLKVLHQDEDEESRNIALRCCYMLFDKIDHQAFLD